MPKIANNKSYIKLNKELKLKGLKKCTQCDQVKDLKDFKKHYRNKNNNEPTHHSYCSPCYRTANKKHEDKYNNTNRKLKQYNLSQDELDILMEKDKCEICQEQIEGYNKHIDHCHDTQFVRGVLCKHCNWGLGHFKDDELRLKSAIKYLQKSKTLQQFQ